MRDTTLAHGVALAGLPIPMMDYFRRFLGAIAIGSLAVFTNLPTASAAQEPGPVALASLRDRGIQVIPRPAMIQVGEGKFTLTARTEILVGADTERVGRCLASTPFALFAVREIILEKDGKSTLKEISAVERLRLPAGSAK
jgi:hypothetical protein